MLLTLRSIKYWLLGWYHHLIGENHQAQHLAAFIAGQESEETGRHIEIKTGGKLMYFFPCGCRVILWRSIIDNSSVGVYKCPLHMQKRKGWSTKNVTS